MSYCGVFYAYVDIEKNNFDFDLSTKSYRTLIQKGIEIKRGVMQQDKDIIHTVENDLSFL